MSVSYTHLDVYKRQELKQCKKQMLETADRIILVGGIYAGKIAGMKYVKKMERHIKMKKIYVFAVGASAYCDDYLEEIKMNNMKTVSYTHLHYTCAKDMAIVGKALIKEGGDDLLKITSTYDAYIREDSEKAFWLVNTNKLLKQYPGVDGLKSGFTSQAMSCITTVSYTHLDVYKRQDR